MDGAHDMGGMHGFGPVDPADGDPYHEAWEPRVHAISGAVAAPGGGRFYIESLAPPVYLAASYYERWLQARIDSLVASGHITRQELDASLARVRSDPDGALPPGDADRYEQARAALAAQRRPGAPSAEAPPPRFAVGDRVTARTIHPQGHTRLPRYVRGRQGTVIRVARPQGFQDDEPVDGRAGRQPVYAVRFDGAELWGDHAEANSSVVLDMWEAYLE